MATNNWKQTLMDFWMNDQSHTYKELEKLVGCLLKQRDHDHEILVNTILEKHKADLDKSFRNGFIEARKVFDKSFPR